MQAPASCLSRTPRWCYRSYCALAKWPRASGLLHRLLFGYRPCRRDVRASALWDWTTLALKHALRRHLPPHARLLDLGTGTVAVLAIYSLRRLRCAQVVASDHLPEVVAAARRQAEALGLPIEFVLSDLFADIRGKFDVIAFNAPYLDVVPAGRMGLLNSPTALQRFSGGEGGMATVARFVEGFAEHLNPTGVALLGVNHFHVPPPRLRALLENRPARVREVLEHRLTHAAVYVLEGPLPANLDVPL